LILITWPISWTPCGTTPRAPHQDFASYSRTRAAGRWRSRCSGVRASAPSGLPPVWPRCSPLRCRLGGPASPSPCFPAQASTAAPPPAAAAVLPRPAVPVSWATALRHRLLAARGQDLRPPDAAARR
jgi:hypothetical protein